MDDTCVNFSYLQIETITDGFSDIHLLWTSNTWELYRGSYQGKGVAAKIWKHPKEDDVNHFQHELNILRSLAHSDHNVVKILGHCFHRNKLAALVLDFDPLSTLHSKLTHESFTWTARLKAASGIAHTISFLHDQLPPLVLQNLEAAHIMLDVNLKPVLYDFGFGQSHVQMSNSDEFKKLHSGHFGTSLTAHDVFDFGSILLALLAMRTVLVGKEHVVDWVNALLWDKKERMIWDARLMYGNFDFSDAEWISALALQCVGRSAKRPCMKKVVASLEDIMYLKISNWRERGMRHPCSAYQGHLSSKTFSDIRELTGGLSADNLLGEVDFILRGCHMRLYRGEMRHDSCSWTKKVTVKICNDKGLSFSHFQDEMMFLTLDCIRSHPNLAKLIGYCKGETTCAVVYDVASHATLQDQLANTQYGWAQRIKAALGIANAVAYLHSQKPPYVLHNLNASNIVLDKDWNPILVDYGLLTGGIFGKKKFFTQLYFGSPGYLDKRECGGGTKMDVYSFGVILLALVSGRLAFDPTRPGKSLVQCAADMNAEIVHPQLKECTGYLDDDAQKMVTLACLCVSPNHELRPTMKKAFRIVDSLRLKLT